MPPALSCRIASPHPSGVEPVMDTRCGDNSISLSSQELQRSRAPDILYPPSPMCRGDDVGIVAKFAGGPSTLSSREGAALVMGRRRTRLSDGRERAHRDVIWPPPPKPPAGWTARVAPSPAGATAQRHSPGGGANGKHHFRRGAICIAASQGPGRTDTARADIPCPRLADQQHKANGVFAATSRALSPRLPHCRHASMRLD